MRQGWSLAVQPECLKGRVVCGTVYGEMHLKDLLRTIARVGYGILGPDFYLVLHGLRCRKKHYNDSINQYLKLIQIYIKHADCKCFGNETNPKICWRPYCLFEADGGMLWGLPDGLNQVLMGL